MVEWVVMRLLDGLDHHQVRVVDGWGPWTHLDASDDDLLAVQDPLEEAGGLRGARERPPVFVGGAGEDVEGVGVAVGALEVEHPALLAREGRDGCVDRLREVDRVELVVADEVVAVLPVMTERGIIGEGRGLISE